MQRVGRKVSIEDMVVLVALMNASDHLTQDTIKIALRMLDTLMRMEHQFQIGVDHSSVDFQNKNDKRVMMVAKLLQELNQL
jgi:hypothetical protein